MSADWSRMKSTAPEQMYNEQYEAEEDLIPTVSQAELEQLRKKHVVVAADINHAWCSHQSLAPNLVKAASKLHRNSKVLQLIRDI